MTQMNTIMPGTSRSPETREDDRPADPLHTVKPTYEVAETPEAWGVTVYLPGVAKEGLELSAEEAQIRLIGRRTWKQPEGWTALHRESSGVPFELVLAHDNTVNTQKVAAELRDGVLRMSLPKQEAVKPRKIIVN